jgi:hypothetical protein
MAIYTVYAPRRVAAPEAEPMALAFIKDRFNWPALFFPLIWLVVRRLWLVLVGYLVVIAAIGALGRALTEEATFFVSAGFAFLFALEANNLRRWTLERNGWRLVGIVEGGNLLEAERRYFSRLLAGDPLAPGEAPDLPPPPRIAPTFTSEHSTPVVGLFPQGQS